MGNLSILTSLFSELGETIRVKGGTSLPLTPEQMPHAILDLSSYTVSEGVNPTLVNKTCSNFFNASITELSMQIFRSNSSITRIGLPNCSIITSDYTFDYCSKLQWLQMPNLTLISGSYWIRNCYSLKSLYLPQLRSIPYLQSNINIISYYAPRASCVGSSAFTSCAALSNLVTSELTFVGQNAFSRCQQLSSVSLHPSTYICSGGFYNCTNLQSLGTSQFIEGCTLQPNAFAWCTNLSIDNLFDFETYTYYLDEACLYQTGLSGSNWSFSYSSLTITKGHYYYPFGFYSVESVCRFPNLKNVYINTSSTFSCCQFFNNASLSSLIIESNSKAYLNFYNNTIKFCSAGGTSDLTFVNCSIDSLYLLLNQNGLYQTLVFRNTTISSLVFNSSALIRELYLTNQNTSWFSELTTDFNTYLTNVYSLNSYGSLAEVKIAMSVRTGVAYANVYSNPSLYSLRITGLSNNYTRSRYINIQLTSCSVLQKLTLMGSEAFFSFQNSAQYVISNTNLLSDGIYVERYVMYNELRSWASGTTLYNHIYSL